MESKFDWLTLVVKADNSLYTFDECFSMLSDDLKLGDLFNQMIPRHHIPFYDYSLTYLLKIH